MKLTIALRSLVIVALLAVSTSAFAANRVIEVGEDVPEFCWQDVNEVRICHPAFVNTVRVLIYGTGWCPDCNKEMEQIVKRVTTYKDKAVTFISLSAQGFLQGSPPNTEFLKGWKQLHQIPFYVVASPRDPGRSFFAPPVYIPNIVIIGRDNRLVYKAISPSIDDVFAEIKKALGD